jgi:hypothetical protein
MIIFSEMIHQATIDGLAVPVFILYLDTQLTGDPTKDLKHCAMDFTPYVGCDDPEKMSSLILTMMSELIYKSYGEPMNTKPLTDWHATGFDRNFPNGVKL